MERDRLTDELRRLFSRFTDSNASGKIRNVSPVIRFAALEDDDVLHSVLLFRLQAGLPQDTPERARRKVQTLFTRDRHQSFLPRVFKLPMTAHRPRQLPSIPFDQPDDVSYLHEAVRWLSAESGSPHRI